MGQVGRKPAAGGLARTSAIYIAANLLNSAIPFALLPILTRVLKPEDFGVIATFQVLLTFLIPLMGLGLQGAVTREYFDRTPEGRATFVGSALILSLLASIAVTLGFLLTGEWVARILQLPLRWVWIGVVAAMSQCWIQVLLALLQARGEAVRYGVLQVSQTLFGLCLSLYLVLSLGWHWQGRLAGQVVGLAVAGVIASIILISTRMAQFEFGTAEATRDRAKLLAYGLPLIPHLLAGWATSMIDRVFITEYSGLGQTGVYAVGSQIAGILGLVIVSVNTAWTPWVYARLSKGDESDRVWIVRFSAAFLLGSFAAAVLGTALAPWALHWLLGREFQAASGFVWILALSKVVEVLYYVSIVYLFYLQRTRWIASITAFSAFAHLIGCMVWVPRLGAEGATYAALLNASCAALLAFFVARKVYPMPWGQAVFFWRLKRG